MRTKIFLTAVLLAVGLGCGAQTVSLSTNMLDYANLGTLNLDASFSVARHWSLGAGVKYNPFTYRQQSYSLSARYWPWHVYSGWWVSGNMRYQEYNTGGYTTWKYADEQTSEGDRYGGGIAGGYTYMLARNFNLDFGIGVWAGYDVFITYACPHCGRIVDSGRKFFVLPSNLSLSLSYLF
ncbi:MAG: DUF3575 domain-containing protein [Bacteroidales bacterium]|nr:DUF3575 domain-containing protein [Bacteroidales bacterium]